MALRTLFPNLLLSLGVAVLLGCGQGRPHGETGSDSSLALVKTAPIEESCQDLSGHFADPQEMKDGLEWVWNQTGCRYYSVVLRKSVRGPNGVARLKTIESRKYRANGDLELVSEDEKRSVFVSRRLTREGLRVVNLIRDRETGVETRVSTLFSIEQHTGQRVTWTSYDDQRRVVGEKSALKFRQR